MDQNPLMTQMIRLNRAVFETAFSTLSLLQDHAQMMGNLFMEQAQWMPRESKKVSDEWMNACRKGRENFKKAVDESFAKAESFLARP